MVTVFVIISLIIILAILNAATDDVVINNTEEKPINMNTDEIETMNEAQIKNNIYQLCLNNGFIKNFGELKIYDPTEKDEDDLFDEVFVVKNWPRMDNVYVKTEYITRCIKNFITDEEITEYITRCIKNCITDEEITVVMFPRGELNITNKLDKDCHPISYYLDEVDESNIDYYFCYSKREIEKVELEKQIEKLNIPKYISCYFDVHKYCLRFYTEYKEVEDLTISRNDLSKDKILQTIEECKKRYAQKHEKSNTIRNQIQNIFN